MKKIMICVAMLFGCMVKSYAQEQEIQQLALNIEKLVQLKQIYSQMKKGYEIVSTGYSTIKDLSQGNFNLHKTYLDGLLQVSPGVRQYKRAAQIVGMEATLLKEYRTAYNRFKGKGMFHPDEISYMGSVYDKLVSESTKNMDELAMVITSGKLRMSDDERIKAIDRIYAEMQDELSFLRYFNNNASVLGVQRAKQRKEINMMRQLSGVQ